MYWSSRINNMEIIIDECLKIVKHGLLPDMAENHTKRLNIATTRVKTEEVIQNKGPDYTEAHEFRHE